MEINWIVVGTVFIGVIALVGFIVWKNNKDQKEYQAYLDQNDPATNEDLGNIEDTH